MEPFVHPDLEAEVAAIGGRYALFKEARLPFEGREVLYLVGYGLFDTACCGLGGCGYALVPGFVVEWKSRRTADGQPVSLVEPVTDEAVRRRVARLIREREAVQEVRFAVEGR